MTLTEQQLTRFWAKVKKTGTCWVWTGGTNSNGYGAFGINGKPVGAHRVSWMHANKKVIAPGDFVCHSCDKPLCVNPAHLWIGDAKANKTDSVTKGRHHKPPRLTHCKRGHPMVGGNIYHRKRGSLNCRTCKACAIARDTARRLKQKHTETHP